MDEPPTAVNPDDLKAQAKAAAAIIAKFHTGYVPLQPDPPPPKVNGHDTSKPLNGHKDSKWQANLRKYMQAHPRPPYAERAAQGQVGAYMLQASRIEPRNVQWMWRDKLARGALHLIAGQPSTGKTTIALSLAAAISSGAKWPDGTLAPKGRVAIWSGEDSSDMTLVPRLMAMGADLDNILFLKGGMHAFDPAEDMGKLSRDLADEEDIVMVILDPIVNATKGDSHKGTEVRRSLQPFVDLLEKRNIAGIGVTHFAKSTQGRLTHERVLGSVAFTAVARVVFATAGGRDGGGEHRLVVAKNNLGPMGGGFTYKVQKVSDVDGKGLEATRITWGEKLDGDATDLIAEVEGAKLGRPPKQDAATTLLKELFKDGETVPYQDVEAACERHHISTKTLKRAGKAMGLVTGLKIDPQDPRSKEMWRLVKVKF